MTHHDLTRSQFRPGPSRRRSTHALTWPLVTLTLFLAAVLLAGLAQDIPQDTTQPDWHGNVAVSGTGG